MMEKKDCPVCDFAQECAYLYLFETKLWAAGADVIESVMGDGKGQSEDPPRPFVMCPVEPYGGEVKAGGRVSLEIRLVGRGMGHFMFVSDALKKFASLGVGTGKWPLEFKGLTDALTGGTLDSRRHRNLMVLPSRAVVFGERIKQPVDVALDFTTPVRLSSGGRIVNKIYFTVLVRALLRRLTELAAHHCGVEPDINYRQLLDGAEKVLLQKDSTRVFSFSRYSNKQAAHIDQPGIVGGMTFKNVPGEFIPLLRFGEALHVGKGTSMGLGRYKLSVGA
jgi:hypothetical protein